MADPIIIAAIGTMIVIASVLVTGPYISTLQSQLSHLEASILNDEKNLEGAAAAIQRSYQHYFPAEIKLAILKTSSNMQNQSVILTEVFRSFVQGILERHVAAKGHGPSQERFKEIETLAQRAAGSDQLAATELSELSASLISDWAQRNESLVQARNSKKIEAGVLKQKISNWRNVAITLQIVGLIIVLFKDVATTGHS